MEKIAVITQLAQENRTIRSTAEAVNMPTSTVGGIVKRFRNNGQTSANRVGRCGRKRKLSPCTVRKLGRASQANPQASARDIQETVGGSALNVHVNTVKRSLRSSGRLTYRPVKAPSLSAKQCRVRLQWCRQYKDWTQEQWLRVRNSMGVDEEDTFFLYVSYFNLGCVFG